MYERREKYRAELETRDQQQQQAIESLEKLEIEHDYEIVPDLDDLSNIMQQEMKETRNEILASNNTHSDEKQENKEQTETKEVELIEVKFGNSSKANSIFSANTQDSEKTG
mgnify:CR=1 FL=1